MSRTPWHRYAPRAQCVTGARTGLTQDLRGRQRHYFAAMLVRSGCVVLMAAAWNRWPVVAVCALAGAVVIPFVAVVASQAGWRQQRGDRPELVGAPVEPTARVVLEPTLVLPPQRNTAG